MEESVLTFSTADKRPLYLEQLYKNASCFLVVSGPSLLKLNLNLLKQPGIVTFGVNNSPKIFRPNLWTCVDDPEKFMISIWKDPLILKFVPFFKNGKPIFDNTIWEMSDLTPQQCPNVVYYHRNEHFNHETYLSEPTVNWGNHKKYGGKRSVLMATIKIAYLLGFSRVFLVGTDFKMELNKQNYAWKQDRSKSSVNGNNATYNAMNERFTQLRPIFEKNNFFVYNCTPESGLKSFPYLPLEAATRIALSNFPNITNERVDGMYERKKD